MALYDGIRIDINVDYGAGKGPVKVGHVSIDAVVDAEQLNQLIDHIHGLWEHSGASDVNVELKTKSAFG
tara:strand:+ start:10343 stop:10549 length:207 start_codon:yes stop_codon:yes gene_type:complete